MLDSLVADLDAWTECTEPVLPDLMEPLRDVLGTDKTLAFHTGFDVDTHCVDDMWASRIGVPRRGLKETGDRWIRSCDERWALYTPRAVEPFQRNRPVPVGTWRELVERGAGGRIATDQLALTAEEEGRMRENLALGRRFWARYAGIADDHQLRMLISEGRTLVAWVGALQSEPFEEAQIQAFERLAPALSRRVRADVLRATSARAGAFAEALLDVIAEPAFIVSSYGRILAANAGGRRRFERDRRSLRQLLADAARGASGEYETRPIRLRGCGGLQLVVERLPSSSVEPRIASTAAAAGLTPRETQIYGCIARGWSNRRIAAELRVAERTVETHVTRMLGKLGVDSRSAAVSLLLGFEAS